MNEASVAVRVINSAGAAQEVLEQWMTDSPVVPGVSLRFRFAVREYERNRGILLLAEALEIVTVAGAKYLAEYARDYSGGGSGSVPATPWRIVLVAVDPADFDAAASVFALDDARAWDGLAAWVEPRGYVFRDALTLESRATAVGKVFRDSPLDSPRAPSAGVPPIAAKPTP